MKIGDVDGEYPLKDFREISMKFSGKMWLMIILKIAKIYLSVTDIFLEKPQGGEGEGVGELTAPAV